MVIHPDYRRNIENTLKDVPNDMDLYFQAEIGDWVCVVTKDTVIEKAYEEMPTWFFNSMKNVRLDGNKVYPVFTPVEQAAWDAAQREYVRQKIEYCKKYGCE